MTAKTTKVSPKGNKRIEVSSFENNEELSAVEPSLSSINDSYLKDNGKIFDNTSQTK